MVKKKKPQNCHSAGLCSMKSTAPRTVLLFKEQLHHWPAVGCTQELGRLQEGLLGLKERALRVPCQHGSSCACHFRQHSGVALDIGGEGLGMDPAFPPRTGLGLDFSPGSYNLCCCLS